VATTVAAVLVDVLAVAAAFKVLLSCDTLTRLMLLLQQLVHLQFL
jgi:hypothetical protein